MAVSTSLVSCYFEAGDSGKWARMARVLRFTAAHQCPGWTCTIERLPIPITRAGRIAAHENNSVKLAYWNRAVQSAREGDRLLMLDADTMILRPLDDLWLTAFDLAYTVKDSKPAFNAGVFALHVHDGTRAFMNTWVTHNDRLLEETPTKMSWQLRYGGVNQASLASVLPQAESEFGLSVSALPCHEWNCEDVSWASFGPATRIVHIKGDLRRMLFYGPIYRKPDLSPLSEIWRSLERDALRTVEAR